MKQTKTTIRELRRFYKGVLLNCLAIIAGLAIAVNAEATSLNVDTSNLTVSGSSLSGTATVDVTGLATTDITDFDTTVTGLANTAIDTSIASGSLQTALGAKADATDVYTKTEVDTSLRTEVDTSLSAKADSADLTALSDAVGTTITSTGSLNGSEIGNGTTVAGALGTLDDAIAKNADDITQNTDSITALQGIVGDGLSAQTGLANVETTDTLTDAVVKLDTAVKGNSDAIAQNTADIAQNTADITQNKTDIAQNKADIAQNTADIAQNTADIAQNTADIAQNTATIGAGTAMGTSGVLASETLGSDSSSVTVAGALGILSDTIGNMSLPTANGNFSDASSTVTEALSDLDLALGDRNWEGYDKGIGNALASNSSVSDAVAQLNTNIGSSSDLSGGTHVSSSTSIYGNLASLDATIGGAIGANSNTVLADATLGDGSAGTVTVAGALGSVSNAIGTLTYENTASVSYDPIATGSDLTTAVSQVASNIGTATTSAINGVQANATVNANIDAINNTIGDMSTLSARDEQASVGDSLTNGTGTAPVTVVEALNNIDATLGQIHGLSDKLAVNGAGTNLATGTTVEDHLTAVDAAIGDRTNIGSANVAINNATATSVASGLQTVGNTIGDMDFAATGYLSGTTDLSSGLRTLDSQLYGVHSDVQRLENEVRGGFASMAALSALVPNARAAGDTQLSMGTGVYRDRAGFAIGAFHYLNDNTLLNVGGAYGGSKSGVVRAGVTFGW